MTYPHDDTCTFCNQDVCGVQLIRDYQSYFSDAYSTIKEEVSDAKRDIERKLGGDALTTVVQEIAVEEAKRVFWGEFTQVPDSGYEQDRIGASFCRICHST